MFNSNTDRDWERFGRDDPYFGVMTSEKFRASGLSAEVKEEFFASGHEYVESLLAKIRSQVHLDFRTERALDFGCGVGRLAIPLASLAGHVTGVDVSESMLQEARSNCTARGIDNVVFVKSDDELSGLKGTFDFVHSFIVFQHIPVARGERIFRGLVERLEQGGIGVVHFTYARDGLWAKVLPWIKDYIPFAKNVASMIRGRGFFAPQMQMNHYNVSALLSILQDAGIREFWAELMTHKGGQRGVVLYFRKAA